MISSKFTKSISLFIAMCVLTFSFAACGSKESGDSSAGSSATAGESTVSTVEEKIDPFEKYTPTIEMTAARFSAGNFKFEPGNPDAESLEKNIWIRAYEEQLGINVKYLWTPPLDQYEQKWNVAIASNDIPDMAPVTANTYKMLVDADMVEDMTDVFEKYASPMYKEYNEMDNGLTKQFSTFNGRLMGLPVVGATPDDTPILAIRTDWLNKLSLPEPKTIDDVYKIAEAFAKNDPDGNGKADTIGMVFNKDIKGGYGDLTGFLNAYNAYWDIWLDDGAGNLVYGCIQPEVKTALLKLQEMYKNGLFDKEFAVKDSWKAGDSIAAGKAGLVYGVYWAPLVKITDNIVADKNAEWKILPIPSVDGQPAKPQASFTPSEYVMVKKGFKYPEAAVKILNLNFKISADSNVDVLKKYIRNDAGTEIFNYKLVHYASKPWSNLNNHLILTDALSTGDTSKLDSVQKNDYDNLKAAMNGDRSQMGMNLVFGQKGAFSIVNKYKNENLIEMNKFTSFPTETLIEKGGIIYPKLQEAFLKVIMGVSIEEYDKAIADWKALGGDKITKEVNEWYKINNN